MSFQLNVTFAGLCLLVNESDRALKVLMPRTGKGSPTHHGSHADPHEARLIYPTSQESSGGTDATKATIVDIEGRSLDLSALESSTALDLTLPKEVVALSSATSRPLNEDLLDGDGDGHLAARIVLTKGKCVWHHPGVEWILDGQPPRFMAIAVTWMLKDVPGASLDLDLVALDGSGSVRRTLHPRADGQLDLYFFHAPTNEIPKTLPPAYMAGANPQPNEQADHFAAFYQLFEQPVSPAPIPVRPPHPVAGATEKGAAEPAFGSLHTCIVGSAAV